MEEVITNILKKYGVSLGYLFGSTARNTAGPLSDVDIAVFFSYSINSPEEEKRENKIKHEIQNAFKIERVDVINLKKNKNIALGYKILFEGKALVISDKYLKRAFETKYLHEFEDMKYFKNIQFNILKNKLYVAN